MSHWTSRAVFTLFLLSLAVFFFIETLLSSPLARFVPLVVVVPTMALLVIQWSMDLRGNLGRILMRLEKVIFSNSEEFRKKAFQRSARTGWALARGSRQGMAMLWMLLLIVLVYLFGLPMAGLLYTFLYLRIGARDKWIPSAVVAAGVWAFTYGVFVLLLHGQYYQGQIWMWLQ